jgi:uncharacterized protein (TIGR02996 family)
MPLADAFLRAIAEQPDADASRRVYADWLEDNGDPEQAEFVRLQLRLAALDEFDPGRPALAGREHELLIEHGMGWARVLVDRGALDWKFRRGTLSWATLTLADFLKHGEAIFDRTSVRRIRLTEAKGGLAALAASPLLARVRRLDLGSNGLEHADLSALARSPHLGGLEELRLAETPFSAAGLADLLAGGALARLEKLDLGGFRGGVEGMAVLARSPALSRLRVLRLAYADLSDTALYALAGAWHLGQLRSLDLTSSVVLTEPGLAALLGGRALPRLARLALGNTPLSRAVADALASAPLANTLEEVSGIAGVAAEALPVLFGLPRARAAARLLVGPTASSKPRSLQPCRAPFLGGEFRLAVSNLIGDVAFLLRAGDFPNLRWLGLHVWWAGGMVPYLTNWPALGRLSVLDLSGTPPRQRGRAPAGRLSGPGRHRAARPVHDRERPAGGPRPAGTVAPPASPRNAVH